MHVTIIQYKINTKYTYTKINYKHSEMGPVRQNQIQRPILFKKLCNYIMLYTQYITEQFSRMLIVHRTTV